MTQKPRELISVTELPKKREGFVAGPHFDCHDLAIKAFGDKHRYSSALPLFAYLWRRFGPPWFGCDGYKEMAQYYLSTRITGLYLSISCKAGSLPFCFAVVFDEEIKKQLPSGPWDPPNEALRQYQFELIWAMRDLVRPVYVRDIPFNIFGEADEILSEYPASKYAGLGMMGALPGLDKLAEKCTQ